MLSSVRDSAVHYLEGPARQRQAPSLALRVGMWDRMPSYAESRKSTHGRLAGSTARRKFIIIEAFYMGLAAFVPASSPRFCSLAALRGRFARRNALGNRNGRTA